MKNFYFGFYFSSKNTLNIARKAFVLLNTISSWVVITESTISRILKLKEVAITKNQWAAGKQWVMQRAVRMNKPCVQWEPVTKPCEAMAAVPPKTTVTKASYFLTWPHSFVHTNKLTKHQPPQNKSLFFTR